jgi:hypothetical protein
MPRQISSRGVGTGTEQLRLRGSGLDAERRPDLLVGEPLHVVHQEHGPVPVRQLVYGPVQPSLQIGVAPGRQASDLSRVIQPHFALSEALYSPEPVQGDRDGDGTDPGGQRRLAAELLQPVERPDERLLHPVLRPVEVSRHAIDQPEDPVHVRLVERPLRTRITRQDSADQFAVVHGLRRVWDMGVDNAIAERVG